MPTGCPTDRFERHYEWAARFARSYCIKRHIREPQLDDCVQAACIAFWKCCNTFDAINYSCVRGYAAKRIIGAIKDQQRQEFLFSCNRRHGRTNVPTIAALGDYAVQPCIIDDVILSDPIEATVYGLLRDGYSQAEIARMSGVSETYVSSHVSSIRDKLNPHNVQIEV